MARAWLATSLAMAACVSSMERAPKQIPASGIVDCTDTMEVPIVAGVFAALSTAGFAYSVTHIGTAWIWILPLGALAFEELSGAAVGVSYALDCRDAKRLGAEQAKIFVRKEAEARSRAKARAEAGTLSKQAAAAARADDCVTVRQLDPQIRDLDLEFHDVVFARDVAIARCLATRQ